MFIIAIISLILGTLTLNQVKEVSDDDSKLQNYILPASRFFTHIHNRVFNFGDIIIWYTSLESQRQRSGGI
jgi:hypothetical protein